MSYIFSIITVYFLDNDETKLSYHKVQLDRICWLYEDQFLIPT